jgi:UDP-4-amino-4,6-dideoxy-N-acetyl-beta-L-altrosamine transaminase
MAFDLRVEKDSTGKGGRIVSGNIPYSHQSIDENDIRAVVKVLRSGWLTQGPAIRDFENALCRYTGARYAVCVANGTAALHLACLAAGIRQGDEVITSAITFAASANCALYCGAIPVFADILPQTINIDPLEIVKKINRRTKAVIPVHFAGHPCQMDKISKIAKRNKLIVIEDAAHALGAEYKGEKIGSCRYSDMAIFSFHPVKSIATGEGGAVLTNNKAYYDRLLMLRTHGITKENLVYAAQGGWYYEMQELGFNYRITDIQAALGVSQMKKIDKFISNRREIAAIYDRAFSNNPAFDIPFEKKGVRSAYHLYPIRLKGEFKNMRKEVFENLRAKGLGVQVHYIPVYLQPYYRKSLYYKPGLCPNAEDYSSCCISIPLYPAMTDSQIKQVIKTLKEVFHV